MMSSKRKKLGSPIRSVEDGQAYLSIPNQNILTGLESVIDQSFQGRQPIYIHPGKIQSQFGFEPVCASSLSYHYCGEHTTHEHLAILQKYFFVGFKLWDGHEDVKRALCLAFVNVLASLTEKQWSPLYVCKSRIFDARLRQKQKTITSEPGVRSVYALNLVNMVCDAYNYTMVEEDVTSELENNSQVSDKSRADYVCWVKLENEGGNDVPVTIVETKHLQKLDEKCIAQLLGYYVKSRMGKSVVHDSEEGCYQGTAILFNEFAGNIQMVFMIFPYVGGVQAIHLPIIECSSDDLIDGYFIHLFMVMCSSDLRFKCSLVHPFSVVGPKSTIFVTTLKETMEIEHKKIMEEAEAKVQEAEAKAEAKVQEAEAMVKEAQKKMQEMSKELQELRRQKSM
ncbi:uncharacterized protein [Dysidea avara]|uniref:uncharacterized protein isoform X2 n=1 Tax=Dysidea avara TaxID=196820 RepID=UPI0033167133